MHVGEKLRKLREEALGMGRAEFSETTGIPKQTLIKIEQGQTDPRTSTLLKVIEIYPEYTLWLLSEKARKVKQICPAPQRPKRG